jgi:hypothetical protein
MSTFVVHLTRDKDGTAAGDRLRSIIETRRCVAESPFGWATTQDDPVDAARQSQRAVCFTETPLEHIYMQMREIHGRQVQLMPYGLAFTKMRARRLRINPIMYVDQTSVPGEFVNWELSAALNDLRQHAVESGDFHSHPAAKVLPFCEPMGTWPEGQREFWWEREWRHRGHLDFEYEDVALWLCPEDEIDAFAEHLLANGVQPPNLHVIDPRWGLEHIIADLVGHADDVTPFAPGG